MMFLEGDDEGTQKCLDELMAMAQDPSLPYSTHLMRAMCAKLGFDYGACRLHTLPDVVVTFTKALQAHSRLGILANLNLKEAFLGSLSILIELMLCIGTKSMHDSICKCWDEFSTCRNDVLMQLLVAISKFHLGNCVGGMGLLHKAKKQFDRAAAKWFQESGQGTSRVSTTRMNSMKTGSSFETLYSSGVSLLVR